MPAGGPFYLQPKRKWSYSDKLWFEAKPIGWNMLETRFKQMCKDAGLTGNFSNHSARATSITRLYDAGVPEKSIMKRSGHRSIEGVRTYRREDASANILVSDVLSGASTTSNSDLVLDIDEETLVNACIDYEEGASSTLDFSGLLQGASCGTVNININISK